MSIKRTAEVSAVSAPSNVIRKPSRFTSTPMHPESFISEFDLATVLRDKEKWTGENYISIRPYPEIALHNINRLKSRLDFSCGIHPITAACLTLGLDYLAKDEGVVNLIHLRRRFDLAPSTLPGVISNTLSSYLNHFEIETPGRVKRVNPILPENLILRLTGVAAKLGINYSRLAVMCLCFVLSEQESSNIDHRDEMRGCLEKFCVSASIRSRAAKAIMDEFEVPELAKSRRKNEPETADEWEF